MERATEPLCEGIREDRVLRRGIREQRADEHSANDPLRGEPSELELVLRAG